MATSEYAIIMEKVMGNIIFGSGGTGREVAQDLIRKGKKILFFVDSSYQKYQDHRGGGVEICIDNQFYVIPVRSPDDIIHVDFDQIILASLSGDDEMTRTLKNMGIKSNKINRSYVELKLRPRINFLKRFSQQYEKMDYSRNNFCVAEVGVFQGDFAKEINGFFPKSKVYLFDTFEGFDIRDLENENEEKTRSNFGVGHLSNTSVDLVIKKMPHPENVIIKKGYFPETAVGLEDERFCFVNLDPDLYEPVLSGLRFFYPRLIDGGIILVHDYYNTNYCGVKKAVDQFCREERLNFFPIGDDISIAIQKIHR